MLVSCSMQPLQSLVKQPQCIAIQLNVERVVGFYRANLIISDTDTVGVCAVPLHKVLREASVEHVFKQMLRVHLPFSQTKEDHVSQVVHGTLQHDAIMLSWVGKCRAVVAADEC